MIRFGTPLHRTQGLFAGDQWRPTAEDGFSAVEFALVLPVLLLMVGGILEFSLVMTAEVTLSNAVTEVARYGITGRTPDGQTREEAIQDLIVEAGRGLFDADKITIETLVYPDFDSIGRPEPWVDENGNGAYDEGEPYTDMNGNGQWDDDMGAPGVGGPDDIVLYRVTYPWDIYIPLFRPFFGQNGQLELEASVAVRNEPFPN